MNRTRNQPPHRDAAPGRGAVMSPSFRSRPGGTTLGIVAAALAFGLAAAAARAADAPARPVYSATFEDAVTGKNEFVADGKHYWTVDPGADSYQHDVYERPTARPYATVMGKFAADEYYAYLDIVRARVGFDS